MTFEEWFWQRVEITDSCWVWKGRVNSYGYGVSGYGRKAHRLAWMLDGRPLAKRKELHHRCRNKLCVNPEHLELMTVEAHRALPRKTHCKHGHPLISENLYVYASGRRCRTCAQEQSLQRYYRIKG